MNSDFSKSTGVQKLQRVSRILFLEDLEDDAYLAERELRKNGLVFTSQRVDTREDFIKALESFKPDVILSDHSLPQFNSTQAFQLYKESGLTVPFILVTGTVSEEFAVSSLKLGIDDYVVKSNLSRLPSAILNALHQREIENSRKLREDETKRQNEKLEEEVLRRTQEVINEKNFTESIVNSMPGIFYVIDNDRIIRWNKNLESVLGYSADEISKLSFLDLVADKNAVDKQVQRIHRVGVSMFESVIRTKEGNSIPYYFSGLLSQIGASNLIVGMGVDIAELKNTQEKLRLRDERLELAFTSSGNSWWDWDIATGKVDSHPNRYLTLGYSKEEVIPNVKWWHALVHEEDAEPAKVEMKNCLTGRSPMYESQYRLRCKNGDWKWFRVLGKIVSRSEEGRAHSDDRYVR